MEWILVNERLPREDESIIACTDVEHHGISMGTYKVISEQFRWLYHTEIEKWMPLPSPWKEEEA